MKKLLILLFLFCFVKCFGQSVVFRASPAFTVSDGRLQAQYNLLIPRYQDTTQAGVLGNIGIDSVGAIIFCRADNGFYYRSTAHTWLKLSTTSVSGLTSLNGLTASAQVFAIGSAGSDFNINSVGSTHTFNIPSMDASVAVRGLLTNTTQVIPGLKTFSNDAAFLGNVNIKGSKIVSLATGTDRLDTIRDATGVFAFQGDTATYISTNYARVKSRDSVVALIPSLTGYVPTSRTLTINSTTQDLSANRTWNVGTVTSIAKGYGLVADGTITTTGTNTVDSAALALVFKRNKDSLNTINGYTTLYQNSLKASITQLNGKVDTSAAYVNLVYLNTPNVIFGTPVTFTTTNHAATGSLALNNQTGKYVFGNPSNSPGTPSFNLLDSTYLTFGGGVHGQYFNDLRYAPISGGAYVPTSRTLTINGTTFDLSANRTWTVGDALVANPLSQFASTTSAQLLGIISNPTGTGSLVFGTAPTLSNPVVGTQTSTDNSTKAASTAYVTAAISTAISGSNPAVAVQAATTANVSGYTYNNGVSGVGATLTQNSAAVVVIDGYTLLLNDRVLFKNQTTGANNGVYFVSTLGTGIIPAVFTRALDYDMPSDINNTGAIPVVNGTVNSTSSWLLTSSVTTVGTDALTYTQFTYNPSTVITNSTSAGGSLTGTYPNPTIANLAVTNAMIAATTIDLTAKVTGVLPIASGGTGSSTLAGASIPTYTSTNTFTNKRWTARTGSTSSSATPTINTDNVDAYEITSSSVDISSMTTNLSGTPSNFDIIEISFTSSSGSHTLAWGASFVSTSVSLPTTFTTTTTTVILQYRTTSSYGNSKWQCVNTF